MARSYSGRGMFGRSCLAFESMEEFVQAIKDDATDAMADGKDELLPADGWQTDSMGLGIVIYHQRVSYKTWVDSGLGEDDDTEHQCEECGEEGGSVKLRQCGELDDGEYLCDDCKEATDET